MVYEWFGLFSATVLFAPLYEEALKRLIPGFIAYLYLSELWERLMDFGWKPGILNLIRMVTYCTDGYHLHQDFAAQPYWNGVWAHLVHNLRAYILSKILGI
jgi:hypothetical protein